jgi:hypothetical protein
MVAGAGLARKNNQFSFIVIAQTFESGKIYQFWPGLGWSDEMSLTALGSSID